MDLKIKDVAELLNVSETTIRRWLTDGKIPAYKINGQYRFSRDEIENWVMGCKLDPKEGIIFQKIEKITEADDTSLRIGPQQFSLFRAIHNGGVLENVSGDSKEEVISKSMDSIAEKLDLDADVITDLLLDREKLMPTALNHGVAVPHTRDFLLPGPQDAVTVVYPSSPLNYGALDGQPVHTLFFLFATSDKRHLHLLAKIAHLCSNSELLSFLQTRPEKSELLDKIREWEPQQ